jgi:hypothetical protein
MKTQTFFWAWNNYPAQPDTHNTRKRAAVLLRAWRAQMRKKSNNQQIVKFEILRPHVYKVTSTYGETGTMFVGVSA